MNGKNQVYLHRMDTSPYSAPDFQDREKRALERLSGVSYFHSMQELAAAPGDAPIIWITNTQTDLKRIPDSLLARTALLIHPNSGYDNFSYDFVEQASFPIIIGSGIRGQAVAEFVLSVLMHHYSPLPRENKWNPDRNWKRSILKEKKLLLIGKGRIGKLLEQVLSPLVSSINFYDPFKGHQRLPDGKEIDILILCSGLNRTSEHLIEGEFLQKLGPQTLIINPARGKLIKEEDLSRFLSQNPQAYAYLDVHEKEPYDRATWTGHHNVHLTSHIAGVYDRLDQEIIQMEEAVLKEFLPTLVGHERKEKSPLFMEFMERYREEILQNRMEKKQRFLI